MRFTAFHFKNFRGLSSASINLARRPTGRINALVGLNESGKTTILEAIHHFLTNPNLLKKSPSHYKRTDADAQAMLPISKRALFNGMVEIRADVEVESKDWAKIEVFLKSEFGFKKVDRVEKFSICHRTTFENSNVKSVTNIWHIQFAGYKAQKRTKIVLREGDWLKAATFVEGFLPKIVYFPSTLIEFPDRIVLESSEEKGGEPKNDFYCGVLQDILRAIDSKLKLDVHLIARAKSDVASDKQNLDALLVRIGQHLTKTVFSEWEKIFGSSPQTRYRDFRVTVSNAQGQLSLEVKLLTSEGIFSINERSAGFRWFFAFILLTRYRLFREDRVLFLFDEPAANLHPNAQTQLLRSFELLAGEADIIYSTHSHHLINPLWLESTHVVRNEGVSAAGDPLDASPLGSSIEAIPYRTFVGSYPEQYFYYRPIQEALDYVPSPLEFPASVVLVEGKTDFFALRYFAMMQSRETIRPALFPGGGAGSLDPLISLLNGWGKNFLVLVDSDEAGERQKKRYAEKFGQIVSGRLLSLEDIEVAWKGKQIEGVIRPEDLDLIRQDRFPQEHRLSKKNLHLAIQELIALKSMLPFSEATLDNFRKILVRLDADLKTVAQLNS